MRARRRGQAIVEFGVIALLFTALMFATVDFGLLLNTWLAVSSGTRDIARNASVGKKTATLNDEATKLTIPSVDWNGFGSACCTASSAVHMTVEYFPSNCIPGPGCTAFSAGQVYTDYGGTYPNGTPGGHPAADDHLRVTLVAQGAQVITPLLRPFFGCTNGANPKCYVPLQSVVIMRYEGQEF